MGRERRVWGWGGEWQKISITLLLNCSLTWMYKYTSEYYIGNNSKLHNLRQILVYRGIYNTLRMSVLGNSSRPSFKYEFSGVSDY